MAAAGETRGILAVFVRRPEVRSEVAGTVNGAGFAPIAYRSREAQWDERDSREIDVDYNGDGTC